MSSGQMRTFPGFHFFPSIPLSVSLPHFVTVIVLFFSLLLLLCFFTVLSVSVRAFKCVKQLISLAMCTFGKETYTQVLLLQRLCLHLLVYLYVRDVLLSARVNINGCL